MILFNDIDTGPDISKLQMQQKHRLIAYNNNRIPCELCKREIYFTFKRLVKEYEYDSASKLMYNVHIEIISDLIDHGELRCFIAFVCAYGDINFTQYLSFKYVDVVSYYLCEQNNISYDALRRSIYLDEMIIEKMLKLNKSVHADMLGFLHESGFIIDKFLYSWCFRNTHGWFHTDVTKYHILKYIVLNLVCDTTTNITIKKTYKFYMIQHDYRIL